MHGYKDIDITREGTSGADIALPSSVNAFLFVVATNK